MATSNNYNSNEKLLLSENIVNYAMDLCGADSESRALLQSLSDIRFCGANPAEVRSGLSSDAVLACKMLSDKIVNSMEAYGNQCRQNRRNVSSQSKESESVASQSAKPNVVGGDMALHKDSLELMIDFAGEEGDSDLAQYLEALHEVRFKEADPEIVKMGLSRRAKMVFIMSIDRIVADKTKYEHRCEQNRQNASRRRRKSAASADAASPVVVAYTPDASAQIVDRVPQLEVPVLSTPNESTAADQIQTHLDLVTVNQTEIVGDTVATDVSTSSVTVGNDRSRSLTVDGNTKTNSNYKSNTLSPPSPPTPDKKCENHSDLQDQFDRLFSLYPRQESKSRAWSVFVRLNPDTERMTQIINGLHRAESIDRRFLSGYAPQLYNWLLHEEWREENMQLTHNYPQGQYGSQHDQIANSYDQRPPMTEDEMAERNRRTLDVLRARYGTI